MKENIKKKLFSGTAVLFTMLAFGLVVLTIVSAPVSADSAEQAITLTSSNELSSVAGTCGADGSSCDGTCGGSCGGSCPAAKTGGCGCGR